MTVTRRLPDGDTTVTHGRCAQKFRASPSKANAGPTFNELRERANTYTTTLHAINSCVVKLSKLTCATHVYRGLSERALPNEFWKKNEFGVMGGVESGFMSTTTFRDVRRGVSTPRRSRSNGCHRSNGYAGSNGRNGPSPSAVRRGVSIRKSSSHQPHGCTPPSWDARPTLPAQLPHWQVYPPELNSSRPTSRPTPRRSRWTTRAVRRLRAFSSRRAASRASRACRACRACRA